VSAADAPGALERRLAGKSFVITAEITPPASASRDDLLALAEPFRGLADAVNVTDGARARTHMSSLAASAILAAEGIEPVMQATCRDRNRIALQSDLLGAAALGVRNILVLRGDDPSAGDQPEAKPVFDLDSTALLRAARAMEEGKLPHGRPLAGTAPRFLLGAADTPIDPPPRWQPVKLREKLEAGARFIQTQFCFDLEVVRRYAARLAEAGLEPNLLIGIGPLASARSALWMREKLFGTLIPDALIARLDDAKEPEEEGLRIGAELLQGLSRIPGVAGAHLMAPRSLAAVPEMIRRSGLQDG
jgi:methylenetetrahydrofolate reductase (NADPH)